MKVIGRETKKVSDLKPHPESLKIYGKDEPLDTSLLERIKERGILEPIVIEESGFITSGVQRWRCAKKLGMEEIEAMIVQYDNPLERKKDILDRNVKREKTFSQKMREAEAWEDIEKKEAEERKSRGGRGVQMNTPSGKVRDIVAKRIKMGSGTTYHRAKKVWTKAKNGSKYAKQQVEKLDKKETTISRAYITLKEKESEQTKSSSRKTKTESESSKSSDESEEAKLDEPLTRTFDLSYFREVKKKKRIFISKEESRPVEGLEVTLIGQKRSHFQVESVEEKDQVYEVRLKR